tara:strand:- start:271 stop:1113 length:843 start_codon:yes stop_codon:yes gene_type:complete
MNKINIINPLNKEYINKLEKKNLKTFLGGGISSIPGKALSTIKGILTTNYIQIGKEMINNIRSNKQLHAKLKEMGYELYLVAGEGALFITEEKNEKLKAGIEATSNIGNFLFLPFKSLGIVVYSLIMTACSGFPPCALIHRVLKTGNRFLKVFTKTIELGLRIATGNLEEFNNMLQLIIEAFVMIPRTIQKLIHIFNLGKEVGRALRGEEIEVDESFMSEDNGGMFNNFSMSNMSLENVKEMATGSVGSLEKKDSKNNKDNKKTKKANKKNKKTKKKKKK